jgi:SWI/SNF-related matrix-associated actin-dependent regulator of chromatin subfamily A3
MINCGYSLSPLKDRRNIGLGDLIEPPPITDHTQVPVRGDDDDDEDDDLRAGSSAKIDQLIHLLRLIPSTDKSLVFSQFTGFLDKACDTISLTKILAGSLNCQIGNALDAEGIEYCRFDGKMSAKKRAETISKFCVPVRDTPTFTEEPVGMSSRLRHPKQPQSQAMEIDDEGDNTSDFVLDDDQSDYDDADPRDEERPQKKQKKGKGRARAPGKVPAKSKILEALEELDGESNPRVMLISLKGEIVVSNDLLALKVAS